jgi:hypothetical protein
MLGRKLPACGLEDGDESDGSEEHRQDESSEGRAVREGGDGLGGFDALAVGV